jgi:predicted RNase H-like HicB family nuclease
VEDWRPTAAFASRSCCLISHLLNGTILAGFPDVPEAHTFGDDRDEALARAVDANEDRLHALHGQSQSNSEAEFAKLICSSR